MRTSVARKLEKTRALMLRLGLSKRYVSRQTTVCLLALSDARERPGLLPGKAVLRDGARIHDILEFARHDLGIRVAENTRESYRKGSLKPLYDAGFITRHQLSVNDPNTFYRLHPDLLALLEGPRPRRELVERLAQRKTPILGRPAGGGVARLRVQVEADKYFTLSASDHNRLEKEVVERFGPAFISNPLLLFIGDAARKSGYQNRAVMRELNLPLAVTESLPDVILYSMETKELVVVEAVVTSGIVDDSRLAQLQELTSPAIAFGIRVQFLTAFSSRLAMRRFVDRIAWGTSVWAASEPGSLIIFKRGRGSGEEDSG